MFDDSTARVALLGFMSTRCDVSSQHKLPTMSEILSTITVEYIGKERARALIQMMIEENALRAYGPYISDREIDVL